MIGKIIDIAFGKIRLLNRWSINYLVLKDNLATLWEFTKCIINLVVLVKWIISQYQEWKMDRVLDKFDSGYLYHNKFDEG